jgi:hypothetical protein
VAAWRVSSWTVISDSWYPTMVARALFFHVSAVSGDVEPASGDRVTFALGEDSQGRPRAFEIELVRNDDHDPTRQR